MSFVDGPIFPPTDQYSAVSENVAFFLVSVISSDFFSSFIVYSLIHLLQIDALVEIREDLEVDIPPVSANNYSVFKLLTTSTYMSQ